jgi:integrase
MNKSKPRNIIEYSSVKKAFENMTLARGQPVPQKTREAYIGGLSYYIAFCNSEIKADKKWTPDSLVEEAKENVKQSQIRIVNFYQWLQGKLVEGYEPFTKKGKPYKISESSARQRAYSSVRGFYSNNDIIFPKSFKCPVIKAPEFIQADESVPFFKMDERNGKFVLDRGLMKHFLSNMKLRDQAIALSLLSTSQDGGDLFSLNIEWATMQIDAWVQREKRGDKVDRHFYWHGNRSKTGIEFKVFFTKEATEFVTRYIDQERKEAGKDDPLFVISGNGNSRRMEPRHISDVFRDVAMKLGVKNGGKYQNPLRPKRLRHIFKTACSHAGIDEGYVQVFMGHKSSISQTYLEKPVQVLEIQFSRVEPLLTVFGVAESESLRGLEQQLTEERAKRAQQQDHIEKLEERIRNTEEKLDKILEKLSK